MFLLTFQHSITRLDKFEVKYYNCCLTRFVLCLSKVEFTESILFALKYYSIGSVENVKVIERSRVMLLYKPKYIETLKYNSPASDNFGVIRKFSG